jgi:hypothetical protein
VLILPVLNTPRPGIQDNIMTTEQSKEEIMKELQENFRHCMMPEDYIALGKFLSTALDTHAQYEVENFKKELKTKMQTIEYPKKSPDENEQDYRKRKRGFQLGKSKFINIVSSR